MRWGAICSATKFTVKKGNSYCPLLTVLTSLNRMIFPYPQQIPYRLMVYLWCLAFAVLWLDVDISVPALNE
jgi:preprotein translocase subunit SecY